MKKWMMLVLLATCTLGAQAADREMKAANDTLVVTTTRLIWITQVRHALLLSWQRLLNCSARMRKSGLTMLQLGVTSTLALMTRAKVIWLVSVLEAGGFLQSLSCLPFGSTSMLSICASQSFLAQASLLSHGIGQAQRARRRTRGTCTSAMAASATGTVRFSAAATCVPLQHFINPSTL